MVQIFTERIQIANKYDLILLKTNGTRKNKEINSNETKSSGYKSPTNFFKNSFNIYYIT